MVKVRLASELVILTETLNGDSLTVVVGVIVVVVAVVAVVVVVVVVVVVSCVVGLSSPKLRTSLRVRDWTRFTGPRVDSFLRGLNCFADSCC